MPNSSIADISAFEAIQNNAHAQMGLNPMGMFNYTADEVFQKAVDSLIRKQEELEAEAVASQKMVDDITLQRRMAASEFERNKPALEAPLKQFGVTVVWEEPKPI